MTDINIEMTRKGGLPWHQSLIGIGLYIGQAALIFALFSVVTALIFAPYLPHLSSALFGPPEDNLQDFWNSWYAAKAHGSAFFFTDLIRFPEGTALNYHSFSYPHIGLVAALSAVFGSDMQTLLLLHNVGLLLSFPLAGLGAFYLVRHFTSHMSASFSVSLVGGFIFAFNPAHVAHLEHHTHVSMIGFLPFFVVTWLLAMERKKPGWLIVASIFWALCGLSCWYYLFYAAYFVLFHSVYQMLRDRAWPKGWDLYAPVMGAVGTFILMSPLILPMLLEGHRSEAYQGGGNKYVADLLAYFIPPVQHLFGVFTTPVYDLFSGNPWEATVYLGLANLALLFWLWRRNRQEPIAQLPYILWAMLVFAVLASGNTLHVAGVSIYFLLPNALISELPFFANVRTPSRSIMMVYLFLAVAVAWALQKLWQMRDGRASWVLVAIIGLVLLDFAPVRIEMTPVRCEAGWAAVKADRDTRFGILALPNDYIGNNYSMTQQACHERPIAQGVVSRQLQKTLADKLEIADMAQQKRQLEAARIKYIAIKPQAGFSFAWRDERDGKRASYDQTYRKIYSDKDFTLYRVY